jgi:hypothetical protein
VGGRSSTLGRTQSWGSGAVEGPAPALSPKRWVLVGTVALVWVVWQLYWARCSILARWHRPTQRRRRRDPPRTEKRKASKIKVRSLGIFLPLLRSVAFAKSQWWGNVDEVLRVVWNKDSDNEQMIQTVIYSFLSSSIYTCMVVIWRGGTTVRQSSLVRRHDCTAKGHQN